MKKQKTQLQLIQKHLQSGKALTPLQALEKFGCFRLAAVIFNLKNTFGMKIKTELKDIDGKRFATYKIVK